MINSTAEKECLARISSAADKIPPFWIQDPELWFYHVETVFNGESIYNSMTKFQIIISKIQIDILVPVRDIIKSPGDKPYENIKSTLISTYLASEKKRIQQLLKGKDLDNKKPSQLLKIILKLAGYGTVSGVVKNLWIESLPQNMQPILISVGLKDINKLAEFADKLQEAFPSGRVSEVNQGSVPYLPEENYFNQNPTSSLEAKIRDLSEQIALMSSEIKFNQERGCNYRIGRGFQMNKDYSDCMCYYHFKFREKARKCATPCSWANTNHYTSYNRLHEQPLW
ncbi:uncharacterized protein [Halyomorpha halys]|uniref:uncharacterized protein n=1 Tax=Halyomorpha halys TaxID=286706 RepID=UPI0006D512CA|nr:uncharacterized protein LOC106678647 [Halyomorpha halys]